MRTSQRLMGTDSGPVCPHCKGTVYTYILHCAYDGEDTEDRADVTVTPTCNGCSTVGHTIRFGRMEDPEIEAMTAVRLRMSHERNVRNHESHDRDVAARRTK